MESETHEILSELREAISCEISASAASRGRQYTVDDGSRVAVSDEGFLYSFKADLRVSIPPESPIYFRGGSAMRVGGVWVGQDDFDVLVLLKENVGESIRRATISVDLTYILTELKERLNENSESDLTRRLNSRAPRRQVFDSKCYLDSLRSLGDLGLERNESQSQAIKSCLSNSIHFVWGPPGTGKTANLAQVCRVLSDQSEKVLVIAHANAAVDAASLKVADAFQNSLSLTNGQVLRIGLPQLAEVRHRTDLSAFGALKLHYPELLSSLEELETERADITSQFGKGLRNQGLKQRLEEVRRAISEINHRLREAESNLIDRASVILATASKFVIDERIWKFGHENIVVDETSMLGFPFVFAAAGRASRRLLLFGDFRQLPPVCVSENPVAQKWLGRDAFDLVGIQTAIDRGESDPRVTLLDTQYRMEDSIGRVVSEFCYQGKLKTDESSSHAVKHLASIRPCPGHSIAFVDSSGISSACFIERKAGSFSRVNPLHALLAICTARTIVTSGAPKVAIITPYSAQARLIAGLIKCCGLEADVTTATIHRFQGSEQDAVLVDLVDALPQYRASNLTGSDTEVSARLLNVAISRARGKLVFLADRSFLEVYHTARSPAFKLSRLISSFPSSRPEELQLDLPEIQWIGSWSDAQVSLFNTLETLKVENINVPKGFSPSIQLERRISEVAKGMDSIAQRDMELLSFFFLTGEEKVIIGGRTPESPIVAVTGGSQAELRRAIIGDGSVPRTWNLR